MCIQQRVEYAVNMQQHCLDMFTRVCSNSDAASKGAHTFNRHASNRQQHTRRINGMFVSSMPACANNICPENATGQYPDAAASSCGHLQYTQKELVREPTLISNFPCTFGWHTHYSHVVLNHLCCTVLLPRTCCIFYTFSRSHHQVSCIHHVLQDMSIFGGFARPFRIRTNATPSKQLLVSTTP